MLLTVPAARCDGGPVYYRMIRDDGRTLPNVFDNDATARQLIR
jgi:hypothetical protein